MVVCFGSSERCEAAILISWMAVLWSVGSGCLTLADQFLALRLVLPPDDRFCVAQLCPVLPT